MKYKQVCVYVHAKHIQEGILAEMGMYAKKVLNILTVQMWDETTWGRAKNVLNNLTVQMWDENTWGRAKKLLNNLTVQMWDENTSWHIKNVLNDLTVHMWDVTIFKIFCNLISCWISKSGTSSCIKYKVWHSTTESC